MDETEKGLRVRLAKLEKDAAEFKNDIDHWNRTHPNEPPIPYGLEAVDEQIAAVRAALGMTPPRTA